MSRSESIGATEDRAMCQTDTFFLCLEQSARHFDASVMIARSEMLEGARHHALDTIYTAIFFNSKFGGGVTQHG